HRSPFRGRRVVEIRIGEQSQAHAPGGLAVIRSDGEIPAPARQVLAAGPDRDARVFLRVRERVGRTIRAGLALVELQPEPLGIRFLRLLETGFVDEPEIAEAILSAEAELGMRR